MEKLEKILKELQHEHLYKILGIERTKDEAVIKKAYKMSVRHYHPDKNKEKNTVEIFQKIQKAYEVLKNEELRLAYDSQLDKKELTRIRNENLDSERKKFADDLKKREEENKMKSNEEEFMRKKHFRDFKREEKVNQSKDKFEENSQDKPKKSFEDKLSNYGIKIKWSKNLEFGITKETIHSYFKEFGMIDEIICKLDTNKALILFNSDSNFNQTLNLIKNDKVIKQLFKIKRLNKINKAENEEQFDKIKSAFLDSNVLNKIKNIKMQSSIEFMKDKQEKCIKKERDFVSANSNSTAEKDRNSDLLNLDLEDFEKKAFEKFKMRTMK